MFKIADNLNNEFKIVISSNKNYFNYNIISSYKTLEEAKQNMNQDIAKYRMNNNEWWRVSNPKYHAVIRAN